MHLLTVVDPVEYCLRTYFQLSYLYAILIPVPFASVVPLSGYALTPARASLADPLWFCHIASTSAVVSDNMHADTAQSSGAVRSLQHLLAFIAKFIAGLNAPVVWQVLQESFDPIIDKATKENLLLLMTKAEVKGEYDYRGMYTALLNHQGRAVCAAVFRAFGAQLAEVPLVATKADARRQGHCRVLMTAFEVLLKEVRHTQATDGNIFLYLPGICSKWDTDSVCIALEAAIILKHKLIDAEQHREGPFFSFLLSLFHL